MNEEAFVDTKACTKIQLFAKNDEKCYVSVGFPFQELNLPATLAPINVEPDCLLLSSKSHPKFKYAGDYLVTINDDQSLSVLKLKWFREEIKVYVNSGKLYTDHKFYFLKCNFLTLKYKMQKKEEEVALGPTATSHAV